MRETDDKYPEYAEPLEPVKGAKHHKKADLSKIPFLLLGLLIAFSVYRPELPEEPEPAETPEPVAAVIPVPSDTVPEPVPEPSAAPIPSQIPEPVIINNPQMTPEPSEEPETAPQINPAPEVSPTEEKPQENRTASVIITGVQTTAAYTGKEIVISGFTYEVYEEGSRVSSDSVSIAVKETDGVYPAMIRGTELGTYSMGLSADSFSVSSGVFQNMNISVQDGWLRIVPADLTVKITGNTATVRYTEEEQYVYGYTVSIPGDAVLTEAEISGPTAFAYGIEYGTYPMGLKAEDFSTENKNYNVTFDVTDGWLKIMEEKTAFITISGTSRIGSAAFTYDGTAHSVSGFTFSAVDDYGTDIDSSLIQVVLETPSKAFLEGTDVGTLVMNLEAADFTITSEEYTDFEITAIQQGAMQINPAVITVTIEGNSVSVPYNGSVQSINGYSIDIPSGSAFDESMITGPAQADASASGTEPGTYQMGLSSGDFTSSSTNHDVTFAVTDGSLTINPTYLTVIIKGNEKTVSYSESEQSVSGYTLAAMDGDGEAVGESAYTVALVSGKEAVAKGTDPGTYAMNLTKDDFIVTASEYSDITVEYYDGSLTITEIAADKIPPSISLIPEMSVIGTSGSKDIYAGFKLTAWNDMKGGTLKATLYISDDDGATWTASTLSDSDGSGSVTVTAGDEELSEPIGRELKAHVDYLGYTTPTFKGKIVLEYTYKDGTTGTDELGPFNIHVANFAVINRDYGTNGVTVDAAGPIIELIIDTDLVPEDEINIGYFFILVNGNPVSGAPGTGKPWMNRYTGTDGKVHMQLAFMSASEITMPAQVSGMIELVYDDSSGTYWTTDISIDETVN